MEKPYDIEILVQKYFDGSCTSEEQQTLENLLKSGEIGEAMFKEYAALHKWSVDALQRENGLPKAKVFTLGTILRWSAVAAAVAGFAFLGYKNFSENTVLDKEHYLALTIDQSKTQFLNPDKEILLKNKQDEVVGEMKNGKLYMQDAPSSQFLTLKIAAGKKLSVVLQDGSELLMNSVSEASFPDSFSKAEARNVKLKGEAFFSVAKNAQKPFYVYTDKLVTKVLGTKFNVNSYVDETNAVTLLEGSVEVSLKDKKEKVMLKPGEVMVLAKNKSLTKKTDNVQKNIGWTNNLLIFENEPVGNIFNKMEKVYGITIKNENQKINNEHFTGNFKDENLKDALEIFKTFYGFSYEINGNTVTIK